MLSLRSKQVLSGFIYTRATSITYSVHLDSKLLQESDEVIVETPWKWEGQALKRGDKFIATAK